MDKGQVFFAKHDGLAEFKLVGPIRVGDTYQATAAMDAILDRMFEEGGFDRVLIDLTEATTIDSTNLGLLAKIARYCEERLGNKATIVSTNEDVNEILDNVGFGDVFLIVHEDQSPKAALKTLAEVDDSEKDFARLVLEAHQALVDLNKKNQDMFQNVVDVFEREVRE